MVIYTVTTQMLGKQGIRFSELFSDEKSFPPGPFESHTPVVWVLVLLVFSKTDRLAPAPPFPTLTPCVYLAVPAV